MKKVVLITGAAVGIGRATANRLLDEGYIVYGGDVQFERMKKQKHENFHPLNMDVTSDKQVQDGVKEIIKKEGKIDYLFANAGYCLLGPVELHDAETVLHQFDVNVVGCGRVIAAVLPHMRKQKRGTIAITSSAAGHASVADMAWYPSTKFAQQGLAQGLRMEVKEFGIKVVLIEPGYIRTEIDKASFPYLDKAEKHPQAQAYKKQMKIFRKKWGEGITNGSNPDTIARVVSKAFRAKNPKRRYHPNMDAKAAYWIKKLFGDWLLERILPGQTIK